MKLDRAYDQYDLDDRIHMIDVLAGLKSARQIVYRCMKAAPHLELEDDFHRAESAYRQFTVDMGCAYEPPFDAEAHRAWRENGSPPTERPAGSGGAP